LKLGALTQRRPNPSLRIGGAPLHGFLVEGFNDVKSVARALSRCRRKSAMGLQPWKFQVPVTASRHVLIAEARKARCVEAEVRWRWTLKVLKTAA
jgi:hypothetical protein